LPGGSAVLHAGRAGNFTARHARSPRRSLCSPKPHKKRAAYRRARIKSWLAKSQPFGARQLFVYICL
jgi:hypothetical protein